MMPRRSASKTSSLAQRFAAAAAALAGFAVLLVAGVSWWWIERLQDEASRLLRQQDVELQAARVDQILSGIDERVAEIAASPLLMTALTDSSGRDSYLLPYLSSIRSINAVPVDLLFVDFQGEELARNGAFEQGPQDRALLIRLLAEGRGGATASPDGSALVLAAPVRYPRTGSVEGAIWLRLRTADLLRDDRYRLVVGAPAPAAASSAGAQTPAPLVGSLADLRVAVDRVAVEPPRFRGHLRLAALVAASLALGTAVALLAHRLARRLTADLEALDRFANRVAERGAVEDRASEQGALEVSSLASSVNRMLERIEEQHRSLQSETQARLHLLDTCVAHLQDVVIITEAEATPEGHRIVFVNHAFERLTGYRRDEVIGRTPRLLQGPLTSRAELDRVGESLRKWQPVQAEVVNYTKEGRPFWLEMSIVPVLDERGWVTHWVAVERDSSERRDAEATRRELEQQVRESQKMEAIGTLAGGIAHDFNNILGAVLGNLSLARSDLAEGRSPLGRLDQIDRSAARARALVQKILGFSRREAEQRVPQDLRALVDEVVSLLRATVSAQVRFEVEHGDVPVVVQGDATALQQVLMNLGTNAWQALRDGCGTVRCTLATVALAAGGPQGLPAGRYARLEVSDDGCGMDEATQARIFEPFFTTKPVGTGTGLGLSVVRGIVRSHGGSIGVRSVPGKGSVFTVLLPLDEAGIPAVAAPSASPLPRGGGERVLYVDDDEVMRTVAEGLLAQWGYHVRSYGDAAAALDHVRADPHGVDLVVTDHNMPGISGLELARSLWRLRPQLPVILVSGYVSEETDQNARAAGIFALVGKEHLAEELAPLAQRALERGRLCPQ